MKHQIIAPPQHLSDYIRMFWFLEFDASPENIFTHLSFAYHCCEITFCYKGQFKVQSATNPTSILASGIYGQTLHNSTITSDQSFGIFGIYLYPYTLKQLLGIPACALTNQMLDMRALCGKTGEELEEKIMLATNNQERVSIAIRFFESLLRNIQSENTAICRSIKTLSNNYNLVSVNALANNHYLSLRQFERKFKELTGFAPQKFLRIVRFNALLTKPILNNRLINIALHFGFYDEAHFSRDFKELSGLSPKKYFKAACKAASDRGIVQVL